jgi:hypothetical protein
MATKRRFEAGFDIIMRDLRATFRRMEPSGVTIALGGVLSQQATREIARIGWAIETQQPALMPLGAAIGGSRRRSGTCAVAGRQATVADAPRRPTTPIHVRRGFVHRCYRATQG